MTPRWYKILQKLQASTRVVPGPLPTPCWEWTGPDDGEQGYGRMSLDGHTVKVHRVSFMQFNGYLPPKKQVDHLCRNRRCWNPDHLEAVTHKQNQRRRRKAVLGACMEGGITMVHGPSLGLYDGQCSCERLGVTPGVRAGKWCPGCPKNPQRPHQEPAPGIVPQEPPGREPLAGPPLLGFGVPAGQVLTDSGWKPLEDSLVTGKVAESEDS